MYQEQCVCILCTAWGRKFFFQSVFTFAPSIPFLSFFSLPLSVYMSRWKEAHASANSSYSLYVCSSCESCLLNTEFPLFEHTVHTELESWKRVVDWEAQHSTACPSPVTIIIIFIFLLSVSSHSYSTEQYSFSNDAELVAHIAIIINIGASPLPSFLREVFLLVCCSQRVRKRLTDSLIVCFSRSNFHVSCS